MISSSGLAPADEKDEGVLRETKEGEPMEEAEEKTEAGPQAEMEEEQGEKETEEDLEDEDVDVGTGGLKAGDPAPVYTEELLDSLAERLARVFVSQHTATQAELEEEKNKTNQAVAAQEKRRKEGSAKKPLSEWMAFRNKIEAEAKLALEEIDEETGLITPAAGTAVTAYIQEKYKNRSKEEKEW